MFGACEAADLGAASAGSHFLGAISCVASCQVQLIIISSNGAVSRAASNALWLCGADAFRPPRNDSASCCSQRNVHSSVPTTTNRKTTLIAAKIRSFSHQKGNRISVSKGNGLDGSWTLMTGCSCRQEQQVMLQNHPEHFFSISDGSSGTVLE